MNHCGLIGKQIEYSYSKAIHNFLGNPNYDLYSFDTENDVLNFIKSGFSFLNVTVPYKALAYAISDVKSADCRATKVANCLIYKNFKIHAYNTDIFGFKYLLSLRKIIVLGKNCLILGTGATSKTVEFVLQKMGAKSISFFSRNPKNSNEYSYSDDSILKKADIIINATPIKDKSLIDFKKSKRGKIYIDLNYNPYNTRMIIEAKKNGLEAYNGLPMLVAQAIKSHELYSGKKVAKSMYTKINVFLVKSFVKLVLIGHPLSGKTTIGKAISEKLKIQHLDLDKIIEQSQGKNISMIFANFGEEMFRRIEDATLSSLNNKSGIVLSLGGGTIQNQKQLENLARNSIIIKVSRPLKLINTNKLSSRPLCKDLSGYVQLMKKRENLYLNMFSNIDVLNDNTINKAVKDVISKLWKSL